MHNVIHIKNLKDGKDKNNRIKLENTVPVRTNAVIRVEPDRNEIESRKHLTGSFQNYIENYLKAFELENQRVTNPIFVDEIASKAAKIYESVRRIIDWKEEHLLRRSSIERALSRNFISHIYGIPVIADIQTDDMAEMLVLELVRSGYFKNGSISKDKISQIELILDRCLDILKNTKFDQDHKLNGKKQNDSLRKNKINFYRWVIEIVSCEIEYTLDPPLREYSLIKLMEDCLHERIKVLPKQSLTDENIVIQIFVAVRKTLFRLDDPVIKHDVLKLKYPDFFNTDNLRDKAVDIFNIREEIDNIFKQRYSRHFYSIAQKYDAAYLLIGDSMDKSLALEMDPDDLVSSPKTLFEIVEKVYNKRLSTLKKRLYRLAIFSTLSIFVAGGISLLIFEIPVAKFVNGTFSFWAILADLAIPTALMFILVYMIKPPEKDNLKVVKDEINKIAFKSEALDIYEVRLNVKKKKITNTIFAGLYLIAGFLSLYFIFWIFKIAKVPWTSLYINTANVAMVVFAAIGIKQKANELTIFEKDNLFDFILEPFYIPLAKIGAWFSSKWREYNIAGIFLTVLVDYPFSTFVAAIESWRDFLREKKSGLFN